MGQLYQTNGKRQEYSGFFEDFFENTY